MIMQIALIFLAVLFFYLALRLIIKFYPSLLSQDRLSRTEELLSLSRLEAIFIKDQLKNPYAKAFLATRLLAHLNLLSYFVSSQEKKQIQLDIQAFRQDFRHVLDKKEFHYCRNLFANLQENIQQIATQNLAEFNYQMSLEQINQMRILIDQGFSLIEEIETRCGRLSATLQKITQNQTSETAEVVNSLIGAFDEVVNELATSPKYNLSQLRNLSYRLDQIESLAAEVSGIDQTIETVSWQNYYEILDIPATASKEEIKTAYRQMMGKWHPDKKQAEIKKLTDLMIINIVEKIFNDQSVLINQAYEVLSNQEQKSDYDQNYQARKGGIVNV